MSLQQQALGAFQTFNNQVNRNGYLGKLEQQTNIPKHYIALGAVGLYFFMIFLNIGGIGQLLANIAGLCVPGYYSLVALETPGSTDDTQYLTYWVVFAALSVVEFWSSFILYWVPFYWFLKSVFLLWLGSPEFGGANLVYRRFLRPLAHNFLGIRPSVATNLKEKVQGTTTGAQL